ncbi:unnamed protein product [Microthlaspi erraticum]|uniref:Uncharacterized protein n=1 Tax=Microthlaspi erraticum TaxID=1685480 RepID=A0A6D2K5N9_9BRAS|nr:unnamed protein product [Microthlaspi erraticum]
MTIATVFAADTAVWERWGGMIRCFGLYRSPARIRISDFFDLVKTTRDPQSEPDLYLPRWFSLFGFYGI